MVRWMQMAGGGAVGRWSPRGCSCSYRKAVTVVLLLKGRKILHKIKRVRLFPCVILYHHEPTAPSRGPLLVRVSARTAPPRTFATLLIFPAALLLPLPLLLQLLHTRLAVALHTAALRTRAE